MSGLTRKNSTSWQIVLTQTTLSPENWVQAITDRQSLERVAYCRSSTGRELSTVEV